ncbi:Putative oligopeptide transporter, OPT superfamily [Septoria linicola]|uniref:Oligopeptide transporter, OPT superfamily n=1 Tax=Septoria linicola TaxID=215465 RepID=A0A9Q9AMJ7_9PEZI|nr:Putative oligopeptide transporter, OPT superfamily [Septoria linicola]
MSDSKSKDLIEATTTSLSSQDLDEKKLRDYYNHLVTAKHAELVLQLTEDNFLAAQEEAEKLSLSDVKTILTHSYGLHEFDPNFPHAILAKIKEVVENEEIFENPEKHSLLVQEMKLEAAVLATSSPHAEVRAVVNNTDDVKIPSSTIRSWIIGLGFVCVVAFMNQLFSVRQPSISVQSEVVQLLSYPVGKAWEKFLPDIGFNLFGVRHSLNPGPFSKKEHMLITIMATVGSTLPSSRYIISTQFLEKYFNQPYSGSFLYQVLMALSTDLMGYGLAGFMRKILVYPAYCLYPKCLVTIALNSSLHKDKNSCVVGPGKKSWFISRFQFFLWAFLCMFVYFWFPKYILQALSAFNWIAWIAPRNVTLSAMTGFSKGMGLNPLPAFDRNILTHSVDPLVIPWNTTINKFLGTLVAGCMVAGMWYTNAFNTGYLPINTSTLYKNNSSTYDVQQILDDRGWLDPVKYQTYSQAWMSSASLRYASKGLDRRVVELQNYVLWIVAPDSRLGALAEAAG